MRDYRSKDILPVWIPQSFTLTALATVQQTLQFAANYDFELHSIWGQSSADLDTDFMPGNFTLAIDGTVSGITWTNNIFVNQRIMVSPSNGGNPLIRPITFPANSQVQLRVTDTTNGSNTVMIVFHGYYLLTGAR